MGAARRAEHQALACGRQALCRADDVGAAGHRVVESAAQGRLRSAPRRRQAREIAGQNSGMKLQSVELRVPDVAKTAEFFEKVWGLTPVGGGKLRGTAALPYIVGLEPGAPSIRSITFCAPRPELGEEREVKGPDGETYRFVFEQPTAPLP